MLEAPAKALSEAELELDAGRERPLRCVLCRRAVTAPAERTRIAGAHAHEFSNPAGQRFRIGCFSDAPGAEARGAASGFWSWFDGYRWRIAECRGCGAQLGWQFVRSGGGGFFGLILAALADGDRDETGPGA